MEKETFQVSFKLTNIKENGTQMVEQKKNW